MTRLPTALWLAAAILAVLGAIFGRNPHPHFWWEAIPAYAAVAGFAGAHLLAFLAKSVLAPLLRSEEEDGE